MGAGTWCGADADDAGEADDAGDADDAVDADEADDAGEADEADEAGEADDAGGADASLAQQSISKQSEELARYTICPGSGTQCNGNQCCAGFSGSGGLTFPCPNADDGWNGCQGPFPAHGDGGSCCY